MKKKRYLQHKRKGKNVTKQRVEKREFGKTKKFLEFGKM